MKKIYDSKVIQYSMDGVKLNVFLNADEASRNISNYDSIIRCCLKKYKTAGGYIWRFEGEDFNITSKRDKNKHINCKICSSEESIRSMSMHLKWAHNIKVNEYVEKYGEFRPKQLLNIEKTNISIFKCEVCGEKLKSNQHLMYHLTKNHPELTKHDYIIEHMLGNVAPLCKCGCGQEVKILNNGKNCDLKKDIYHRDYIKGHIDWEVFSNIGKQSKEELEVLSFIKDIYQDEIQTSIKGIIKTIT